MGQLWCLTKLKARCGCRIEWTHRESGTFTFSRNSWPILHQPYTVDEFFSSCYEKQERTLRMYLNWGKLKPRVITRYHGLRRRRQGKDFYSERQGRVSAPTRADFKIRASASGPAGQRPTGRLLPPRIRAQGQGQFRVR